MERVDAQPVRAPRSGLTLLIAAPTIDDPQLRWTGGFRWQPEVRAGSSAIGLTCEGSNAARTPADQPGTEEFDPFLIWAAERCSTKDKTRDWQGRARRSLESEASFLVAGEFWDGTVGHSLGNRSLADENAEILTSGPVPGGVALTYVDSALTRRLRNRQGMVSCRPEMVDVWTAGNLLRVESGSTLTPLGHVVVADAGYTGTGPRVDEGGDPIAATEDSQWVYGTDLPYMRIGKVDVADVESETTKRDTNDRTVWAQKLVGIEWDHHAHIAVEVAQGALS